MDTNVNYTVVGAFVIGLIASITFAIIWLSSGLSSVPYKNYIMLSQESVSGLTVDAPVEYNGVNVGSVSNVTLDESNPHLVKVLIRIKASTPITQGTTAMLASRGVTGVAFIALKDTGTDLEPLAPTPGQEYPVIPNTPSIFVRLDTALTSLTKNFQAMAQSLHALLDKENLQSFKEILVHVNQVTETLSNNSQQWNTIMMNTARASQSLETQTLPMTYKMLSNLNELTRNLNEVAIQLKQSPSILIRGQAPLPKGPGEK